jgi:hypothetical protein
MGEAPAGGPSRLSAGMQHLRAGVRRPLLKKIPGCTEPRAGTRG